MSDVLEDRVVWLVEDVLEMLRVDREMVDGIIDGVDDVLMLSLGRSDAPLSEMRELLAALRVMGNASRGLMDAVNGITQAMRATRVSEASIAINMEDES
jgi:hypothetical protein